MLWTLIVGQAIAAEGGATRPFARPGELPEQRLYARLVDLGGPVRGLYRRRRSAEFLVWELDGDTVVRVHRYEKGVVVEDRRFDAGGWPLTTVTSDADGPQRVVVHTRPAAELSTDGWTPQEIPGGHIVAPGAPAERPGGGARFSLEGGTLDVWRDERGADVYSDAFRDGLLAGCGCLAVDRATTWVDSQPGARYRLLVPGQEPPDAVDVWAVPRPDGLWLASYRVASPEDPLAALATGRAWIALVTLGAQEPP